MPFEFELPANLITAAIRLEERARILKASGKQIRLDEWDALSPAARKIIPAWYREFLSRHSVTDLLLERPHEMWKTWKRYFAFWTPQTCAHRITPDDPVASRSNGWWLTEQNLQEGFLPISDESDGDLWTIKLDSTPSSPVYIYDLSGGEHRLVSSDLAEFLTGCELSPD